MRLKLLIITLLFISLNNYSQHSDISFDLNYPVTIDKNFVGENYNGIIGLGIDYSFLDLNSVKVGISLNGAFLIENIETGQVNRTLTMLQPRAIAELDLTSNSKIKPYLGVGYSFLFFKSKTTRGLANEPDSPTSNVITNNGFNLNGGVIYNFTEQIFVKMQYDYIILDPGEAMDIKYNTRISLFKIGLGYLF